MRSEPRAQYPEVIAMAKISEKVYFEEHQHHFVLLGLCARVLMSVEINTVCNKS